jgi:hypothetical protein
MAAYATPTTESRHSTLSGSGSGLLTRNDVMTAREVAELAHDYLDRLRASSEGCAPCEPAWAHVAIPAATAAAAACGLTSSEIGARWAVALPRLGKPPMWGVAPWSRAIAFGLTRRCS